MKSIVVAVDDDPIVLEMFRRNIEQEDIHYQGFLDPEIAMAFVTTHTIAFLFVDYNMPKTSGLEFLAKIRHRNCNIENIFLCSSSQLPLEIENTAIKSGARIFYKDSIVKLRKSSILNI